MNVFWLEDARFFMCFCRPSTQKRSQTATTVNKNGCLRKRSPKWKLLKTEVCRFGVEGRNAVSENAGSIGVAIKNLRTRQQKGPKNTWERKRIFGRSFFIP